MKKGNVNPVLALIQKRAMTDRITSKALAKKLSVSESYMSQLLTSNKSISSASDSFIRKSADYLGVPPILCFLMSNKINASDFFDSRVDFDERLRVAIDIISESTPAFEASVSCESLHALASDVKLLIVSLYEKAFHVELLQDRVTTKQVTASIGTYIPFCK